MNCRPPASNTAWWPGPLRLFTVPLSKEATDLLLRDLQSFTHFVAAGFDPMRADNYLSDGSFAKSKAFTWLQQHGAAFGFHLSFPPGNPYGYEYEPWHWRYIAAEEHPARSR